MAGLSRSNVRHNVTINNLLPGLFDTDRQKATVGHWAKERGITFEEMKAQRVAHIPAGRLGVPAEFGDACAFLCSAQMGYVTGQYFLIDGGAYPGTF